MQILMLGGTGYFGVHAVHALLEAGHGVTIATRGTATDGFGTTVRRVTLDRSDAASVYAALAGKTYDVTIDNIAYSSNEVRALLACIETGRYLLTSTVSVYETLHPYLREEEMDTTRYTLRWCDRDAYGYDESKRQAECALFQVYGEQNAAAVRFPLVMGKDDYTKRLFYYVEHIVKGYPMAVDNANEALGFIHSRDAGRFLAWLTGQTLQGAVNAGGAGTITLREIMRYTEKKSGKTALLSDTADAAPFTGFPAYSVDTTRAESAGYRFENIEDWIYDTIDAYIDAL